MSELSSESDDFVLRLSSDEEFDDNGDIYRKDAVHCVYKSTSNLFDYSQLETSPNKNINSHVYDPKLNMKTTVKLRADKSLSMASRSKKKMTTVKRNVIRQQNICDYFSMFNKNFNCVNNGTHMVENDVMINIHDFVYKLFNAQVVLKKIPVTFGTKNKTLIDSQNYTKAAHEAPSISYTNETILPPSSISSKNDAEMMSKKSTATLTDSEKMTLPLIKKNGDENVLVKNLLEEMIDYENKGNVALVRLPPSLTSGKNNRQVVEQSPTSLADTKSNVQGAMKILRPPLTSENETKVTLENFSSSLTNYDRKAKVVVEQLPLTSIDNKNGAKVVKQFTAPLINNKNNVKLSSSLISQNSDSTVSLLRIPAELTNIIENNKLVVLEKPPVSMTNSKNKAKVGSKKLPPSLVVRHEKRKMLEKSNNANGQLQHYQRHCRKCEVEISKGAKMKVKNKCNNCGDKLVFRCEICGKYYTDPKNLRIHVGIHNHFREKNHCTRCTLTFNYISGIYRHYRNIHSKEISSAAGPRYYISTKISKTEEHFFCTACDYSSAHDSELRRHMEFEHFKDTRCYKCDQVFDTNCHRLLHAEHCDKDPRVVSCEAGNYETRSCSAMVKHRKMHRRIFKSDGQVRAEPLERLDSDAPGVIKAHCPKCQKERRPAAGVGSSQCHKCRSRLRYSCAECSREFRAIKIAEKHAARHAGCLALRNCDKCGKAFSRTDHASMHRRVCSVVPS